MSINSEQSYGVNHLWGRALIDRLVLAGVRNFVISPGGRSMGLVVAAREHPGARITVHPDERGAAYFAVGLAKGTGVPAVVISTSGTAVANYYPAVLEAFHSGTPLVVVTADMPEELSSCGENQSISQPGIFGENVLWAKDLRVENSLLEGAEQTETDQIVQSIVEHSTAGPVHLNCRFSKPLLEPALLEKNANAQAFQFSSRGEYSPKKLPVDLSAVEELRKKISKAEKGLISVGRLSAGLETTSIIDFVDELRWPVISDCISSVRWNDRTPETLLLSPDLVLQNKTFSEKLEPDLIVHFGGQPLQNSHNHFLRESSAELVVVDPFSCRINPWGRECSQVQASPVDILKAKIPSAKTSSLSSLSIQVNERLKSIATQEDQFSEIEICREICRITEPRESLFVGNSLPIRALDLVASGQPLSLGHNRGVSGIDGLIATATGFLGSAGENYGTLIIGDMSLLHDLNSLALVKKSKRPINVVLLNNQGGQIFSRLPKLPEVSGFQECFVAKPDLEFENAALAFGLEYRRAIDIQSFREEFTAARKAGENCLLEVILEPDAFNKSLAEHGRQVDDVLLGLS